MKVSSDESDDNELPCAFDRIPSSSTSNTSIVCESQLIAGNNINLESPLPASPAICCPTCHNFFLPYTIAEHADVCADEAGADPD